MPDARPASLTLAALDALPDDHDFGGWGLPLVMSLSVTHGLESTATGKWVYAVLQEPPGT
ncbi:hypothetical protein EDD29_4804 [Actinocorallia herbida]|uniref:Anti-sigma regulatory factor (Ser/Thr protein kinase) n=1 Tax=Actinocorallia herbida TaxID=58109 RepID=A0A3N1D129_9ACTN|nr:hypothetical protein [Actinocorallia herbida]ROO87210.1 hypothetical protein EDD29_4804 [Actinocorallia herbida]